ncbi:MAG: hypothetical protein ACQEUM_02640 [Pseudomonadota bacterium]
MSNVADIHAKPQPLPVNFEAIPGALKDHAQWLMWRYDWNPEREEWVKVPYRADGHGKASSNNPASWAAFAQAEAAYKRGGFDGIGFALWADDPFTIVDLDKCQGESWAVDMIEALDSYTEESPSGNGYHVVVEASKPRLMGCKSKDFHSSKVEVYSAERYMTFTGHHVSSTPSTVERRQDALEDVCGPLMGKPKQTPVKPAATPVGDDGELLDRMFRACKGSRELFSGNGSDDASADDLSLCNHMAFMTGSDAARMDRLFRQSALMRPKWDERHRGDGASYGQMTIETAIRGTRNAYDPKRGRAPEDRAILDAEAKEALEAAKEIDTSSRLPDFPQDLMALPHGLGEIQAYIYNRMKYPHPAAAGFAAMSTLTTFAQRHVTIDSYQGLGLNEYYLVFAPTGFGKEDLRTPAKVILGELEDSFGGGERASKLKWAAPSSAQGLHQILQDDGNSAMFLADEFAEWLRMSHKDPTKQQALGYLMQLYSGAFNTVHPGNAVTRKYEDVKNPRVSILATSTAEAMLQSMTEEHAHSGAYNRWVILAMDNDRIQKRYSGMRYEVPTDVLSAVKWVDDLEETHMSISREAWEVFVKIDSQTVEPMRHSDNVMAGRLSEQAIKMAGLIALSDQRVEISASDMETAYSIRLGLYHRSKALLDDSGAIDGQHVTSQAVGQIEGALQRNHTIYRSQLPKLSRKYKALSVRDREAVVSALVDGGSMSQVPGSKAKFMSHLYLDR